MASNLSAGERDASLAVQIVFADARCGRDQLQSIRGQIHRRELGGDAVDHADAGERRGLFGQDHVLAALRA